jgi:hypothetical protein
MLHGYIEYLIDVLVYLESSEIIACLRSVMSGISTVTQHDAMESIIRDKWRLNYDDHDRVTFSFLHSSKNGTVSISTFLMQDCQLFPLEATHEVEGAASLAPSSEVGASPDAPSSEGAASPDAPSSEGAASPDAPSSEGAASPDAPSSEGGASRPLFLSLISLCVLLSRRKSPLVSTWETTKNPWNSSFP